eukprot:Gregarina_sp_Poly_1__9708@NODE_616_length_7127_cov_52_867989_g472_i0_p3_GENE_NODE_616_length_7127_cov_52_867989_g472_i0NODE_616_length_7127_cov_52_867989_g472_i0_p3_ORF_typecomplete_len446_score61_43_NODE_616_length_7127_cov_52_867989_g472_i026684005
MPTPIEWFLREEKDGDGRRQLGASQEWDWRSGSFERFVDRDEYLRAVRVQLYKYLSLRSPNGFVRSRRAQSATPPGHIETSEDRRRIRLLQCLQAALQSRRVKHKMLREQQDAIPFSHMVKQATEDSLLLETAQSSQPRQAAFCTQASAEDFRTMFSLPDEVSPERLFNLDLDPMAHIYPHVRKAPGEPVLGRRDNNSGVSQRSGSGSPSGFGGSGLSRWGPIEKWLRNLGHGGNGHIASSSFEECEAVRPSAVPLMRPRRDILPSQPAISSKSYFPTWQHLDKNALEPYGDGLPPHLARLGAPRLLTPKDGSSPKETPSVSGSRPIATQARSSGSRRDKQRFESEVVHGREAYAPSIIPMFSSAARVSRNTLGSSQFRSFLEQGSRGNRAFEPVRSPPADPDGRVLILGGKQRRALYPVAYDRSSHRQINPVYRTTYKRQAPDL